MPSLSQLCISSLQHEALTSALVEPGVFSFVRMCISVIGCLSFSEELEPPPSACGCCRAVHRSHALLLGECGRVLPWLELVKVLLGGGDQLVLLKYFDFLVNTPTVSYVLFLGNIGSAFMKRARCLGPLVSKGKAMWDWGGRRCRIWGGTRGLQLQPQSMGKHSGPSLGMVYSGCVPAALKPKAEGSQLHLRTLLVPSMFLPSWLQSQQYHTSLCSHSSIRHRPMGNWISI